MAKSPTLKPNPSYARTAEGITPIPKPKPARPNKAVEDIAVVAVSAPLRTSGKMTAFQRMKAQQYEKEGVGGRSMTRAAAQKKAMSEKSGSLKMPSLGRLFAKQGKVTFSQPPKKGATPARLAAFKAKIQGRNK